MAAGLPGMLGGIAGAGGPPGPGGPAPNPIAGMMGLVGKALASNKMAGGKLDSKSLDDVMATVQKLSSQVMHSNPKVYQALLRALQSLHSARGELQQASSRDTAGPPLTSSFLDMVAPQNTMANPLGGGMP